MKISEFLEMVLKLQGNSEEILTIFRDILEIF